MIDDEKQLAEKRLKWLITLAWSGGDKGLQSGWWKYCEAELIKLENHVPGAKGRAIAELKRLRENMKEVTA